MPKLAAVIVGLLLVGCADKAIAPTVTATRTATPKAAAPAPAAPTASADY